MPAAETAEELFQRGNQLYGAGDQAAAGHHIEHGEFFRHPDRRVVERDGVAEHDNGGLGGAAGEGSRHQVGRGHQPVAVLVVFVDADAVKAERVGIFEQVQIVVVDFVAAHWIIQVAVDIDPHGAMLFPEILGQIGPWHEVEPSEFHWCVSPVDFCWGNASAPQVRDANFFAGRWSRLAGGARTAPA